MGVRRIVPNFETSGVGTSTEFYSALLGLEQVMDHGWIVTLADPQHRERQLSLASSDASAPMVPDVSIEVDDVDGTYTAARRLGAEIVHPLTDEPWGVRRFFVRSPDGKILNILSHR